MSVSVIATPAGPSGTAHIENPVVRPDDIGCFLELPCLPESARSARKLVTAALTAWSAEELGDVAELLVSELVGNAAKHTGCTRISVSVNRQKASVWVGVQDSSGALPCRTDPKREAESGYGLGLVESLSSRWGVAWAPLGKWVWFELRTGTS
ncbi:ATP-binding protein [Embleya scabrispora]|uniref:ATP-binding protein n=1 Tax=Embleya scabrispora TaxID=159449 RepID=UPI000D105E27|nr:ATP-binding protein [Embleya scabrispora]MYS87610.1 ATP-binding protein [Streptomyces sp. SID5474]